MKRKHLIPLFLVVILSFALTTSSLAAERRASDQINRYSIAVTPVSNSLQVTFSVYSYSLADKIGCESIEVYEKSGSRWSLMESLDENDAGMSTSNSRKYVNTILLRQRARRGVQGRCNHLRGRQRGPGHQDPDKICDRGVSPTQPQNIQSGPQHCCPPSICQNRDGPDVPKSPPHQPPPSAASPPGGKPGAEPGACFDSQDHA